MSWYLWVFGVVAVLNMLVVGFSVGDEVIAQIKERRRRNDDTVWELNESKREVRILRDENRRLREQVTEIARVNNSFGRISP